MKEIEYIRATNRVKISMAKVLMHDVLSGINYGINDSEKAEIIILLSKAEDKLFSSYDLEPD